MLFVKSFFRTRPLDHATAFETRNDDLAGSECFFEFSLVKNVSDELVDIGDGRLEKIRDLMLRKPDGFRMKPHIDLCLSIFCDMQDELPIRHEGITHSCTYSLRNAVR